MISNNPNPLSKHFRQPAIYLKLPSGGKFYPDGAIDLPVTGDIPVYPMTVKDEMTLKTPDALMNGVGIVEVIKSCCPNIKDPWSMPAVDMDPVFIAMRLASYGKGMDITCTCPACQVENEFTVDLSALLSTVAVADYSQTSTIGELTFKFCPQSYQDLNLAGKISFEEQRLVESVINNDAISEEEKTHLFSESFERLRQMTVESVAVSIESVTTPQGETVKDRVQISEFLNQASRQVYTEVKATIQSLVDQYKLKPIKATCEECKKHFETPLTFNQSNFFE
jgi:hypothetical protein